MLSAKKILPQGSGSVEVSVKTADLSGILEKSVYVLTNDPRNPEVELKIKAKIEPEILLSSSSIFFENAPAGKAMRKEIVITVPEGKQIKLLGVQTNDARVSVKLEQVSGSRGLKWKLIAIRKADAKPGNHIGEIVIATSSRLNPKITIYERGTISAPGK